MVEEITIKKTVDIKITIGSQKLSFKLKKILINIDKKIVF